MTKAMRSLPIWTIILFLTGTALGQQPSARSPSGTAIDTDDGRDDILLIVKVQAKELKMDVVPNSTVTFPGTHRRTTAWLTERKNLPDKLEPGVTYRDIGITLRISSRFENIDEIVREALGETAAAPEPANDKSSTASPPSPPRATDAAVQKARRTSMSRGRRN